MYWDNRSNQYIPPQTAYYVPPNNGPTVPTANPPNPSAQPAEAPTRMTSALKQLSEMGFWNQKLNQELLEKNNFDVNDTIEELLSPIKGRQPPNQPSNGEITTTNETVVSLQPQNNRNGFIDEFD